MIENHMVLNGPDAPWNREDLDPDECQECGHHGRDVAVIASGEQLCRDCREECPFCGRAFSRAEARRGCVEDHECPARPEDIGDLEPITARCVEFTAPEFKEGDAA